jgi:hypothetical protein
VPAVANVCVCDTYFTIDDDGRLCLKPGSTGLQDVLVFSDPGSYTFEKADYPSVARVRVRVQGAGGGSAGADATAGEAIARPGGTGGGYSESLLDVSSLSASENIVVGAGGTPGSGNSDGGNGGSSSFGSVTAPGGFGGTSAQGSGTAADVTSGLAGPLAGTGDFRMGGGASGGAIRLNGTNAMSGAGGDSQMGTGGFPRASQGAGTATRGFGAGAGGALSYGNAYDGQQGSNGLVLVELWA